MISADVVFMSVTLGFGREFLLIEFSCAVLLADVSKVSRYFMRALDQPA